MKKEIIALSLLFYLLSCATKQTMSETSDCILLKSEVSKYIMQYQLTNDTMALDSALLLIERGIHCCPNSDIVLKTRKIQALTFARKYEEAILFLKSIKNPLIENLPYYNDYLLHRLLAMQCLFQKDTLKYIEHLDETLVILESFKAKNQKELLSLYHLNREDSILSNPLILFVDSYYYCKFKRFGEDSIEKEIQLLEKKEQINPVLKIYFRNNHDVSFLDLY